MGKKEELIQTLMKKGMSMEEAQKTADEVFGGEYKNNSNKSNSDKKIIVSVLRYVLGGIIILLGLNFIFVYFLCGLLIILAGISIFPVVWDKLIYVKFRIFDEKMYRIAIPIVLPIILFTSGIVYGRAMTKIKDSKNSFNEESEITTEASYTDEDTYSAENERDKQVNANIYEETTEITTELSFDCSWGIERYNSNEYKYISESDFAGYYPNLSNVKIALVGEVDRVEDNKLYLRTENRGFMFTVCNMLADYNSYSDGLHEMECMVIGTVAEAKSYSFMGDSIEMNDCLIVAYGDDVSKYKKESSDSSLSQYFKVTEGVANSSSTEVSESDFKNLCSVLSYNDIMRNPNNYKGKYCKVSGTVDQVIEGLFSTVTIYVLDGNGNKWECTYLYKDSDSHVLEGDYVTFYGKCKGTTTSSTVLNKQVVMPYIDVEYIK